MTSAQGKALNNSANAQSTTDIDDDLIFEEQFDDVGREMTRLYAAGYSLVPVAGSAGKSACAKFKDRSRLPLGMVLSRMRSKRSTTYGIRLDGLLVVDVDSDTSAARQLVKERKWESTVQVRTSRGLHHYFCYRGGPVPETIIRPGIQINFKCGPNDYVLGPGSIRPDGGRYAYLCGDLSSGEELPTFSVSNQVTHTRSENGQNISIGPPPSVIDKIVTGERHSWLLKQAIGLVRRSQSELDLFNRLKVYRDNHVDDPDSVHEGEIESIANWAWKKRLSGSLYAGQFSAVPINRQAASQIRALKHGDDAFILYWILHANHGHTLGKRFCISHAGLKDAGHVTWSKGRITRARDNLLELGHIVCVKKAAPGKPHVFMLSNAIDNSDVTPLHTPVKKPTSQRNQTNLGQTNG